VLLPGRKGLLQIAGAERHLLRTGEVLRNRGSPEVLREQRDVLRHGVLPQRSSVLRRRVLPAGAVVR
jgi:hypothetical protein